MILRSAVAVGVHVAIDSSVAKMVVKNMMPSKVTKSTPSYGLATGNIIWD